MRNRAGTSAVEVLVALLIGLFLLQAAMWTVARARTYHERLVLRSEALAAVRLAGTLLRMETSAGMEALDWGVRDEVLTLRAFRGTGLVCGALSGSDSVIVSFNGYRRPDPSKDSVLLLYPDGPRQVIGLRDWAQAPGASCRGRALRSPVVLRLAAAAPAGSVVARVFERGAYSFSGRALRYRRGTGGRQPLTPELWESTTGWRVLGDRLEAELLHRREWSPAGERRWRVPVAARSP